MKTIKNIIILLGIFSLCTYHNCSDFVEVDLPDTQLTGDTVFNDVTTAMAALSNVYAQIRERGLLTGRLEGTNTSLGLYADELSYFGSNTLSLFEFFNSNLTPANSFSTLLWNDTYNKIYAVNAVLEGLENSTAIDENDKTQLIGEALFLRALMHSYLVNLYGSIPYITSTNYLDNAQIGKLENELVYARISADLNQANSLLSYDYPSQNRTRANKAAVQALLARTYLHTEQWQLAESLASQVIDQTTLYSLTNNLDAAYLINNPSTLLQLQSGQSGVNTYQGNSFIFNSGPPPLVAMQDNLVAAFSDSDLRKQHWIRSVTDGTTTWYHPYKYKLNQQTGTSQEYAILLRLEEQLLIRAEARAQLGNLDGAKADLNIIKNRAGLPNSAANTQTEVLEEVYNERRLELFTEFGHRWFDLKRTDQASSVLPAIKPGWTSTSLLLPIPENELLLNPNLNPQNPGY